MNVASLIGFGVVFVLVAWTASVVALVGARALAYALRRCGPAAERRILNLATAAPLVIATSVVTILVLSSLVGDDHCAEHHHEVHLCLTHGAAWIHERWAVVLVSAGAALVAWRLACLALAASRNRRTLAALRAMARHEDGTYWLETPDPICFVTRDAEIFVSTGAWNALTPNERIAMLEHERAHIAHRDIVRRLALDLVGVIAAPCTSLAARWHAATERLCDARAATATGDRESVASALVKLARVQRSIPVGMVGFTCDGDALSARVHAVLAEIPIGDRIGNLATWLASGASVLVVALLATHASVLHDALEAICS